LYNATENGYPGDEDQGQTSSWYVLSALGFYSVTPGTGEYVLGSPLFKKVTINLENGKKFVIDAPLNGEKNVYIQRAALNGETYSRNYLSHSDLMKGGILHLHMGEKPALDRGISAGDQPFSLTRQ
jgi:putative alpha-1,2-mannosidase